MALFGPSLREAIAFYESLRAMIRAGIPMTRTLEVLSEQSPGPWRAAAKHLGEQVRNGLPMSEGMDRQPDLFPPLERSLVRAGESGGRLEEAVDQVLKILRRRLETRNQMIVAALYPTVLVHVAIFVPPIGQLLLNGPAAYIEAVLPALFSIYGLAIALFALNLAAGSHAVFGALWDALKLRLPLVGGAFYKSALARFTRCLGALSRSGVTVQPAIEFALDTVGNRAVRGRLASIPASVRAGKTLADAISETKTLPMELDAMVRTGEESGALDDALERVANTLDDDVHYAMQKFGKLFPLFLLLLAIGYGVFRLIQMLVPLLGQIGGVLGK